MTYQKKLLELELLDDECSLFTYKNETFVRKAKQ